MKLNTTQAIFVQHHFSLRFNFTFNGLVWFPFWNVSPQIYDRANVLLTLGSSVGLYMVRQKTGQTNSQTICSRGVHCTGSQHIKHLQRKHDEQKLQKHKCYFVNAFSKCLRDLWIPLRRRIKQDCMIVSLFSWISRGAMGIVKCMLAPLGFTGG